MPSDFHFADTQQKDLTATQLSGEDENGIDILSVIAKKTYTISPDGKCQKSDTSLPLRLDFEFSQDNEGILLADTDSYINKPYTDLVIKGYTRSTGLKKSEIEVEVSNQKNVLRLNIFGSRLAFKNHHGKILFTEPEPIEMIPLEYEYAYGGIDLIAEKKFEHPHKNIFDAFPQYDSTSSSLFRYPRNPCGKGYLVEDNPGAFENFELPNIEDPMTPLTPDNLVAGKPENWIYQPLPRATTWVNPEWFPRLAYFGVLPEFDPEANLKKLPEHMQKLVDSDILQDKLIADKINTRASNGASLGLQFPYLSGNESIRLLNIHPQKQNFILQLPNDRPKIWVDGRKGKLLATAPVIQTVFIEPEKNQLSIVWRGSAAAARPYSEEELKTMPFKVEWK